MANAAPASSAKLALAIVSVLALGACGLDWTVIEDTGSNDGGSGPSGPAATGGGAQGSSVSTGASGNSGGAPGVGGAGGDGVGGGVTTAAASSSVAASTGSGQPACDDELTCAACDGCAVGAQCAAYYTACMNDAACAALDACVYGCSSLADLFCIDECYYEYGVAQPLFDPMMVCIICDTCPSSCLPFQGTWSC